MSSSSRNTAPESLFGKILPPEETQSGRRRDGGGRSKTSDTASRGFAFVRVARERRARGSACSCSPHFRSPNARDWKGMSAKSWRERMKGDRTPTLPDQIGGTPHPEFVEALLGFPIGWSDCEPSETR